LKNEIKAAFRNEAQLFFDVVYGTGQSRPPCECGKKGEKALSPFPTTMFAKKADKKTVPKAWRS